jgi:hypothetical protein
VAVNIYQAVKQAMQDLIAPQLESLRGEVTAVGAGVNALRGEMQSEFKAVRTEFRADLETFRGEVRADMAEVRGDVAEVRGEMAEMRGDLRALRAELNGLRGETSANLVRLDERLTIALDVRERIVALEARLPR